MNRDFIPVPDSTHTTGFTVFSAGRGNEAACGVSIAIRQEVLNVASVRAIRHNGRILEVHLKIQCDKQLCHSKFKRSIVFEWLQKQF